MVSAICATKILLSNVVKKDIKKLVTPMIEYTPRGAKSFSHVRFGSTENPNYSHEIVSFFDKDSNIIGRVSRETGKPDIYTEYEPWENIDSAYDSITKYRKIKRVAVSRNKVVPQCHVVTGGETGFKFNLTKDNDLPMLPNSNIFTHVLSEELQHVYKKTPRFNLSKECEVADQTILFTGITRKYGNNPEIPNQISLKTNDLVIKNGIPGSNTTSANLFLQKTAKDVKIESYEGDVYTISEIIKNPFAPYLYLRPEVKAKYLTRWYARERGLKPLNIKTTIKLNNGNSQANFSPYKGVVCYEKPYAIVPSTAVHEGEHAYQHALAGQNGKINPTSYEQRALKLLGKCPETKKAEAKSYEDAIDNYPKNLNEITNLREYPPYWENKLEKGARFKQEQFEQYDNYPYRNFIEETGF